MYERPNWLLHRLKDATLALKEKVMTTAVTGKPETTEEVKLTRKPLRRYLATSDKPVPRAIRCLSLRRNRLSVPAPRVLVKPMLLIYLGLRFVVFFFRRVDRKST